MRYSFGLVFAVLCLFASFVSASSPCIPSYKGSAICDNVTVGRCGDINVSGIYNLSFSIASTGNCLTIYADDVTLDCLNKNITGANTGTGIYTTHSNTVIRNCNISSFNYGIDIENSDNNTVTNNKFRSDGYGLEKE